MNLNRTIAINVKAHYMAVAPKIPSVSELESVVESAIAEHEKAQQPPSYPIQCTRCGRVFTCPDMTDICTDCLSAAPLCVHCGKPEGEHFGYWQYCDTRYQDGRRFSPATPKLTEPGYRRVEPSEVIQNGDEYSNDDGKTWHRATVFGIERARFADSYRRKLTDIQPVINFMEAVAAQEAPSDGDVAPRNPAKEPTTQEVIEKLTI